MAELTRRYIVMAMATEAPFDLRDPEGPFVLKPWKDPAALAALETYREHCYPELAAELEGWIRAIRSGPVVRGGVGRRNEAHLASRRTPAPARTGPRRRAKVKSKPTEHKTKKRKGKRSR